jgi:hypothetical protein
MHWRAEQHAQVQQSDRVALRWEPLRNGADARLLGGKMSGRCVSDLARDEAGRDYLAWAYRSSQDGLRDIIGGYFE